MKQEWKRICSLLCALILCLTGLALPTGAQTEGDWWTIYDGGRTGKDFSRSAGQHVEWSARNFNLQLPKTLPLEKLGVYMRITLDAAAAEAMNKGGSIELAQATCDKSEINCNLTVANWKVGLNEVIIPMGELGGYSDGGQARFDMYAPINWFRFYTTPGTANLTVDSSITVWEVAVVDSSMLGMEFGVEGAYLLTGAPLSGTPNTVEISVKPTPVSTVWSLGLQGTARTDGTYKMTAKTGKTTAADAAAYGVPEGLSWTGGTVPADGHFGLSGNKFATVFIPSKYDKSHLSLSFWMYSESGLAPGQLYLELTSSGTCDQQELSWSSSALGTLRQGWNHIVLPLSTGAVTGGDIDLSSVNYVRIWSPAQQIGPDEIYVSEMEIVWNGEEVSTDEVSYLFSNAGAEGDELSLWLTSQNCVGWTWGEKSYLTDFGVSTEDWTDLALVRDMESKIFKLYANGELVAQDNARGSADIRPSSAHAIGANAVGEGRYSGWLADVRVFDYAKTQEEIAAGRVAKIGNSTNGLSADTRGLLGSWLLVGSMESFLQVQEDISKHQNHARIISSRAAQWEDYEIPTDVIGEDYYTIVFIPDTQELVTGRFTEEWMASAQWIADNVEKENIVHVIGAGDNTWTDAQAQWNIVREGFDLFSDKVAWSNMTGNHDYPGSCLSVNDTTYTIRDTTNYQNIFGLDYISDSKAADHFVDYFKDPYGISGTENSYYRFKMGEVQWMILQLEYHPRVHVIEWAKSILAQYPDDNVILTTHAYIGNDNADHCTHWMPYTRQDSEIGGYIGELMPTPTTWPNGSELPIWNELIYPNDNVKLLLCGHASTTDGHVLTRWDENAAGNTVPQVMINAQDVDVSYFSSEAMGMLGILRFSADGSRVEIQYYSPYHESSFHPSNQEMRSLTLAVDVPETDEPTEPELPGENEIEQPTDPEQPSDVPGDTQPKNRLPLFLGIGAAVLVGAAAVLAVVLKKKK